MNFPVVLAILSLFVLWFSGWLGAYLRARRKDVKEPTGEDFSIALTATLTLLGLIIGFSFSMAMSRYDQRRNYEEEEANAIGTEYLRAGLLPASDAGRVKSLLTSYLDQRILFYESRSDAKIPEINAETAQLQDQLWDAVQAPAAAQPTPVNALVAAGMNDVLNSQGYTQAAWLNRVPVGAWLLMVFVALSCNVLLGYSEQHTRRMTLVVFPLILTVPFVLIADIDSPRGGIIRVVPQNLIALSQSLQG